MKQGRIPLKDRARDEHLLILGSDRRPVDVVPRRTGALLEDLADRPGFPLDADALRADLDELKTQADALPEWAVKVPQLERRLF
jgi:hypothetical protein